MLVKNSKSQGFTLIELIIVTVLLGILAAVAAPRYLTFTRKAEKAVEIAVVAQLREAVERYANDKFISDGRYEYPANPFQLVEVSTYIGMVGGVDDDGASDQLAESFASALLSSSSPDAGSRKPPGLPGAAQGGR